MKHLYPLSSAERLPLDRPFASEKPRLRKLIAQRGLAGLANDTKWNELLTHFRSTPEKEWTPSFRFRCIDSDYISQWDGEWWHHLPFPFLSVLWLDLNYLEARHRGKLMDDEIIDHSSKLSDLLIAIGFEFERGNGIIRIFGYSPKDYTEFRK
jgi:hypothetical protein